MTHSRCAKKANTCGFVISVVIPNGHRGGALPGGGGPVGTFVKMLQIAQKTYSGVVAELSWEEDQYDPLQVCGRDMTVCREMRFTFLGLLAFLVGVTGHDVKVQALMLQAERMPLRPDTDSSQSFTFGIRWRMRNQFLLFSSSPISTCAPSAQQRFADCDSCRRRCERGAAGLREGRHAGRRHLAGAPAGVPLVIRSGGNLTAFSTRSRYVVPQEALNEVMQAHVVAATQQGATWLVPLLACHAFSYALFQPTYFVICARRRR